MSNLSCEGLPYVDTGVWLADVGAQNGFGLFWSKPWLHAMGIVFFFFLLALVKLSYNHYEKNLRNETSDFRTEKQTNKQQIITEYQRCTEMKNII